MRHSLGLLWLILALMSFSVGCVKNAPSVPLGVSPEHSADVRDLSEPTAYKSVWIDGTEGIKLSSEQLLERLTSARVVYVGEEHTDALHHKIQLEVAQLLSSLGKIKIGLEMVQKPFQKHLDDYISGKISQEELLENVEWEKRWGYDFGLYKPIFDYALNEKIDLIALNATRELVRKIAREGIDALDEDMREELPELLLDNVRHRRRIELVWGQHGHMSKNMSFDNFYAAQVTWDETMAQSATLSGLESEARVLVLAGAGHVRYGEGIPSRAQRRGLKPYITILPVTVSEATLLIGSGIADILWVVSPVHSPHGHGHKS